MSRYTMHTREIESIDHKPESLAVIVAGAGIAALAVLALILVLFTL